MLLLADGNDVAGGPFQEHGDFAGGLLHELDVSSRKRVVVEGQFFHDTCAVAGSGCYRSEAVAAHGTSRREQVQPNGERKSLIQPNAVICQTRSADQIRNPRLILILILILVLDSRFRGRRTKDDGAESGLRNVVVICKRANCLMINVKWSLAAPGVNKMQTSESLVRQVVGTELGLPSSGRDRQRWPGRFSGQVGLDRAELWDQLAAKVVRRALSRRSRQQDQPVIVPDGLRRTGSGAAAESGRASGSTPG
jgi:hypothetical protein